jgi:parallel beta-helix repeat protein
MIAKISATSSAWTALSFLLAGAVSAHAQVCVDPAGGGCEPTIQAGVNLATAGQTITVAPATYVETVTIPAGKDGLIITAKKAVIDNPSAIDGVVILSNTVSISGLTIRNARNGVVVGEKGVTDVSGITLSSMTFEAQAEDAIYVPGSDSVTIQKSRFTACGSDCVETGDYDEPDSSNNIVLTKNRFRYCNNSCAVIRGDSSSFVGNSCVAGGNGRCASVDGNDALVEKNKGNNVDGFIRVQGEHPRVIKNKVRNYGGDAFFVSCTGNCAAGAIIDSNSARYTADDNGAFYINADTAGLVVSNNTSVASADDGFRLGGTGITIDNNLSLASGGDSYENGFDIFGADHVLTGNAAIASANDGYRIMGTNITVEGNLASENYGDGFAVEGLSTGVVLENNVAENNVGEGFELSEEYGPDPVDATFTGNTATGNRTPFCVSVFAGGPIDGGGNSFTVAGAPACQVNH